MKKSLLFVFTFMWFIFLNAQDTTFNEYMGTYTFPEGSAVPTVAITIENGALLASSSAGSSALEKISKDTFNLVSYSGTIYFLRNSQNKIDSIKIETQDVILQGKKEDSASGSRFSNLYFESINYEGLNENLKSCSSENSDCSPVARFFNLYKPVFISSSPIIRTKGILFFSAYLNCLSNFAGS